MPNFNSDVWKDLDGGYRIPFDPRQDLLLLSTDQRSLALDHLWENLYHQGDVGIASYAAVPSLVTAGALSLASAIEVAREKKRNPELPEWLQDEYFSALGVALESVPGDEEEAQGYYVLHAALHGQKRIARALDAMSVEEILHEHD